MGLTYKKIIVAVDGSEQGEKAFEKAVSIAAENNAKLILAHVIDTRSFATVAAFDQSVASKADEFAKEIMEKYTRKAAQGGVENVEKAIEFGSPRAVIPRDIAEKYDADLIICGATGLNTVERFIIGSVSEGIARNAPCDVLIVRNGI
ncbi:MULTISPECIES: universal stress protein [Bacillaceae]|uniref:universal stress protein n=1 Tax=Bacillaceae TaxID=186817 RepID=UPI001E5B9AA1|nr:MULTISPECIES: universal stress protein [Bacillaceae]MCE4051179.1 universal stress protein [Bacillus sp. Au-Bac7]MCM3029856.1 universal stress protein [Niallia sp. MER 6]MDL0436678.1 universal stress protein [Niallia sp. SS-2023]UPO86850.1 universal stress protein [Niallia sp. Man26]